MRKLVLVTGEPEAAPALGRAGRWAGGAWALLLLACAYSWGQFLLQVLIPQFARPHWPDSAYWVVGRLAWEGRGALIYAGADVFTRESLRLGTVGDTFSANMPTTVLPLLPFGLLPEIPAHIAWLVCCLIGFVLAWGILLATLRPAGPIRLALWAAVPFFHPLVPNFEAGQVYPLVLLLLVGGAILARPAAAGARAPARPVLTGVLYGLLAIVKWYYGLALLWPLLIRPSRRLLAAAGGVFGAAVVVTVIWWGPGVWATAIGDSLGWQTNAATAIPAYQTLDGWLTHLLRYDAALNPGPLVRAPGWILPLWAALAAVLFLSSVLACRRAAAQPALSAARQLLPAGLAVLLALLLAPIAADYHYLLALFPLLVGGVAYGELGRRGRRAGGPARLPWAWAAGWTVWGAAAVLLGGDWHFVVLGVGGWPALLDYPRLYGALLLWGLLFGLLRATPAAKAPAEV